MQYDRAEDGTLTPLPAQSVDTGAGLERIAAILQDVPSVFETDAFRPLIDWAEAASGRRYGADPRDDRALRVLADHGRAMTFLTADGVRPGNEGRGYVLRRIIRRAVSEAGQLGLPPEAVAGLSDPVAAGWGEAYPELVDQKSAVENTIGAEAEQFARTLVQGRRLLSEVIERSSGTGRISGDDAFRLYDTYGFPLDLTLEAAGDAGLETDTAAFELLMAEQRERSRGGGRNGDAPDLAGRATALAGSAPQTEFVGYEALDAQTRVSACEELGDGTALLKLERSPFYPQGGGQISDGGEIAGEAGRVEVLDVLRLGDDQVLHVSPGGVLRAGDEVHASVPSGVRHATQANHTATHILNWALRERLGTGVRQAGSYVGPDKLRFDFTHVGRVPPEELEEIERMVNRRVAEDDPVTWTVMARDEADARGATGLFEEKYGERVRVLETGEYSKELCGGTHVSRTGEIGPFKIVSEASTGAGARRIEAVTGLGAVDWYRARERALVEEIEAREARIKALEAELKRARAGRVDVVALAAEATESNGVRALARVVEAGDMDELLALSDQLKKALGPGAAVVLGAAIDGKAVVVANFGDAALAAGLSAADVVRHVAPIVDGGGGGKPGMARAGGKDPGRLADALAAAEERILGAPAA